MAALQLVALCGALAMEPLKFGVIADIQYCDAASSGSRYYRNSLQKLEEAVEELNAEGVRFTVNLGDLVDRDASRNLEPVLARLAKLENGVYNTTGNHDYGDVQDNGWLYGMLGMPASYYAFSEGGWRFIVLNTNEIASYSNMRNGSELTLMLRKIKYENRPNGADYNGGVGAKQRRWLERELKKAERREMNVLLFSHHPLCGVRGLTALDDVEVLELLSRYSTIVRGVISGHHHSGAFEVRGGIPFITTEGMVETEDANAYGVVSVYPDRIEFEGRGRARSY